MEDENISSLVAQTKTAPALVLVDVLDDALAGIGIPRTAAWTATPHRTPPPWVAAMDRERSRPAPPSVDAAVDALATARDAVETTRPDEDEDTAAPSSPRPGPLRRGLGRLVGLIPRPRTTSTPPPPDPGPGTPAPAPVAPPQRQGPAAPDEDEDTAGLVLGLVHETPASDEDEADEDGPLSLDEVRRLVGDEAAPEWTAAPTVKARVRALLWTHSGDTTAVRATWRAQYGQAPPSDVYRYARAWVVEILDALEAAQDPDPLATLGRLVPRRTAAMQRAVDTWAASRATVTPLRRVQ